MAGKTKTKKPKTPKTRAQIWKRIVVLAAVWVICLAFAGINRSYLQEGPLNRYFPLDYPSESTVGNDGSVYVIDQSKQRVSAFTQDGRYRYQIYGGSRSESAFYSAEDVKTDEAGNLYVADTMLAIDGSAIERERILKFGPDGKYLSTVFDMAYEGDDRPITVGKIQGMTYADGHLRFVFAETGKLSLMQVSTSGGEAETVKEIACDTQYLISYAIGGQDQIYAVTKMADILRIEDDGTEIAVYEGEAHDTDEFFSIPWRITADSRGYLYFSDIGLRRIGYVAPDGQTGVAIERMDLEELGNNRIFYSLDVSFDDRLTTIADVDVYVKAPADGGETVLYGSGDGRTPILYSSQYVGFRLLVWAAAAVGLLALLGCLYWFGRLRIRFAFTEMARNNLLIVTVAVIIAGVCISSIMGQMQDQYAAQVMNNMSSVAELACRSLDAEDVEQINTPRDYTSDAYARVKADIQANFNSISGWNEGLYCVLNRVTENKTIYSCLYLEDTVGSVYPLDYDYYESDVYRSISDSGYGSEYQELYETGQQIRFDRIENVDGIWTYVLSPVFNDQGEVVAAMEVGTNLYAFQESNTAMLREMVFSIVSIIAIIILLFTEVTFLWYHRAARQKAIDEAADPDRKRRELAVYLIRPMIFVIFAADCMATAFLPMMASELAVPVGGISQEMMSAIPISTEVFVTAVFSFLGGFLIEKYGFRPVLLMGSILFTAGLFLAGFSDTVFFFIGAKAVIGVGMGLLLVGINSLAASYPEKESAEGFSFYNAGSQAGATVSTTIGSLLVAALGGYARVYFAAAAVSVISLVMMITLLRKDTIYPHKEAGPREERGKMNLFQFLFKKELLIFFLCAMVPYILCGYFLNYFLPLFADAQGMSETTIGQLFLINGICVIYLGPSLTAFVTGKLKSKWSVALAGGIYAATLILFYIFTGNGMVAAAALLFGIADSFGFSALSLYFSGLDAVKTFGSSKAMGVYSTFDNVSQTLGPFVFSAVYVLGVRRGILLLAAVYLVLLALYSLFGRKNAAESAGA